jgi:hypothetical protein
LAKLATVTQWVNGKKELHGHKICLTVEIKFGVLHSFEAATLLKFDPVTHSTDN